MLEIAICRSGIAVASQNTTDPSRHDVPQHPRRLKAKDDTWQEPLYTAGDLVSVTIGGPESSVYGSSEGIVQRVSGSRDTYWIEIDGEAKRIPERWITGLVEQ